MSMSSLISRRLAEQEKRSTLPKPPQAEAPTPPSAPTPSPEPEKVEDVIPPKRRTTPRVAQLRKQLRARLLSTPEEADTW
ncbi:MAG: hypothetical protein HC828_15735, partial [Blastochloris sp.]|nr:hypothetical protein [Blastochloris sp.]